jgi:hypothetical protein
MELFEITEDLKASPGEYIYHHPSRQIVLCGSFNRAHNTIRALARGRMIVDKIENFKKIQLTRDEQMASRVTSGCAGCRQ